MTSLFHSEPSSVNFYLIDLKGGVELCDYENITQTISIAYEPYEAHDTASFLAALFSQKGKLKIVALIVYLDASPFTSRIPFTSYILFIRAMSRSILFL
ncbi:FtsK/SpoIIIE domain-containing protein [Lysinibacillus sphaericus]|nr:FtsK/SpoIIIE domain-containing protein [Lysinibacillus sphaericus]